MQIVLHLKQTAYFFITIRKLGLIIHNFSQTFISVIIPRSDRNECTKLPLKPTEIC